MTVLDPIETFKKPSLPSGEELFQTYSLVINRFLARKVNNRETAEDLVQEVFLRACRALPSLHESENIRGWLYRIAVNVLNDYLRRLRRISWQSIDAWEQEHEMEYPDLMGEDPADRVVENDCIRAALLLLPEGYRQSLLLTACEGYSLQQVAETIGIAPSGVKMYLSRARKRLRLHYQQARTE